MSGMHSSQRLLLLRTYSSKKISYNEVNKMKINTFMLLCIIWVNIYFTEIALKVDTQEFA